MQGRRGYNPIHYPQNEKSRRDAPFVTLTDGTSPLRNPVGMILESPFEVTKVPSLRDLGGEGVGDSSYNRGIPTGF